MSSFMGKPPLYKHPHLGGKSTHPRYEEGEGWARFAGQPFFATDRWKRVPRMPPFAGERLATAIVRNILQHRRKRSQALANHAKTVVPVADSNCLEYKRSMIRPHGQPEARTPR